MTHWCWNRQRFIANPLTIWVATDSNATMRGVDLGEMGRLRCRRALGDFTIAACGMLVAGRGTFTNSRG